VNQLRLWAPVDAAAAFGLCERHLGALPYRHLVVEGDGAGLALDEPMRAQGWEVSRELVMALESPPDLTPASKPAIAELGELEWAAAYRRWHLEDPRISPEDVDQVVAMGLREGRVREDRRFGVLDPGDAGCALAITSLRSDGRVAQVEDVWTAPEARGRGYARALVTHALSLALGPGAAAVGEHELTFIVADDEDWPKELYARLGFEAVGWLWVFHRSA
jgi:GNAT superfamily N-acetyltransferase